MSRLPSWSLPWETDKNRSAACSVLCLWRRRPSNVNKESLKRTTGPLWRRTSSQVYFSFIPCLFSPSLLRWELIVHDVTRNLRRNWRVIITKRQKRYVYRRMRIVNDVTRNLNRYFFIQIPSKQHKKYTGTQVNTSIFIFIADKVFGFPVGRINFGRIKLSSSLFAKQNASFLKK